MTSSFSSVQSLREPETTKNSQFVLGIFWLSIIFQLTALKFIWSIENIARIVNIILLIILILYAFKAIGIEYFSKKIWFWYLLPGLLIIIGMIINISTNAISNTKLFSFFGQTLPWALYLIIPSLMKREKINSEILWKNFYLFMLFANILGIIEYIIIFSGASYLKVLNTPNGLFLGGQFSLFYLLPDKTPYYRYYSCFLEPGTLAMLLLPAISYAYFKRKYFGLVIFILAFILTYSLGGVISLFMLMAVVSFILFNRKKSYILIAFLALVIISSLLWVSFGDDIVKEYKTKGVSAKERVDSFNKTIKNLPVIIFHNPLGLKLAEDTKSFKKNKLYIGSNFIPGSYLQYGGIAAFMGYLFCLSVSFIISLRTILSTSSSLEEKIAFSSLFVLLPFIFQRTTIWETTLFALLFAPSIIRRIEKRRIQN